MKTLKSQLFGLALLLGSTIALDAQGVSAPFEKIVINTEAEKEVIETSANYEISKHIEANLKYPIQVEEFDLTGTSLVKFKLNKEGEITSKAIITSMGALFDNAIMNAVKDLEKVSPVYKNGVANAYAIVVPVKFEIKK